MGKAVYLGKVSLHWCDHCNVPLVAPRCGICGEKGRKVKITPPGEVRIGFEGDLKILNSALQRQFGCKLQKSFVLFNRIPHYDRMDEIIIHGHVIGNLRYDLSKRDFMLSLRMKGAYLLNDCIKKGWVIADKGAIEPVLQGYNLMVPGVLDFHGEIKKGDEVIVRDPEGHAFAVGTAKMNAEEMKEINRGVAVKIRYSGCGTWEKKEDPTVEKVVEANHKHLENLERKGVEFIKRIKEEYASLPLAVSFSGGKDSLVTLLLALDSGLPFTTFFLNTGIELPETVEYIAQIEKEYGIDVERIEADDAFFKYLEHFGPPGRDYRWCCKVCKLGPTTRFILEKYKNGLLTLIGQRRYESFERMRKGSVWKNEWVPNQVSASPIQNWTSLEIWLYILWKKAPINPWYLRGLTRIGCYLCPSSDLADFEIIRHYYPQINEWFYYLKEYAKMHGIPEEWSESSWRWKNPPKWAGGIKAKREKLQIEFNGEEWKTVKFSKEIDEARARNMLWALPPGSWRWEKHLEIHDSFLKEARSLLIRSQECVSCGICLARCPVGALKLEEGIKIEEEKCIHCLDCMGKCPAEEF